MKTVLQAHHLNQLISNVLIGSSQISPSSLLGRVAAGFAQTLAGLEPGVPPHVGPPVGAGDVEQGDTLELGPLS